MIKVRKAAREDIVGVVICEAGKYLRQDGVWISVGEFALIPREVIFSVEEVPCNGI